MTTERAIERVADNVRELLVERFKDDGFVFDPIMVNPQIDHDGEEYLNIRIVFDGDQKLLDPEWTVDLPGLIWPLATDMGFPNVPSHSFIEKSEWEGLCETDRDESVTLA